MTKTILTFLLFLCFARPSFGQSKCEEIDKNVKKGYDSFAKWQFDAIKKRKFVLADSVFNIAEYMRHKADTSYKTWYNKFIDLAKSKQKKDDSIRYFMLGKAYYYTNDLDKSEKFFKCSGLSCNGNMAKCADYYLSKINERRKK